jgi:CSLREA domain-containing protein
LIGPLQNNGGPTLTHALLPGSPALDAGDPNFDPTSTPYDQRGPGFPRIKNGRVCIGAFEAELNQSGSSIIVNTLADHDDGIAGATDCTLREAVKYASAGATITFSVAGTITLTGGEMVITNNLTIIGPTNAPGITVSGNNASRIFTVTRGTVNVSTTVQFSTLTLSGGNGAGSTNTGNGGALYIDTFMPPMIVTVTNCTFSGNHATANGGAIRNGGTLTVTSSTLSSNSASLNAGAIQNGGTLAVTSSTFSGNSTTGTGGNGIGGAIRINAGNLTVTSSTFSGNSASLRGGGIEISTGGTSLSNTIVAGNSAPTGPDINGTVTSGDYNLVQNTAGATLPGTHNLTGQPALLGPLASNGGPTQTHALLSGSPAIDAGDTTLAEDQRGVSRPQGIADDIGAFELQHRPTLSIRVIPLSQVEICWDTVTNRWYQLQYRSTLVTNPWSPLSAWIKGGGQMICTNDSILVGGPQRFYQVGVTNLP